MSLPYDARDMLCCCQRWFEQHCPTAELIGGMGLAEHPMLTAIKATIAAQDLQAPRPPRKRCTLYVAETRGGMSGWVADIPGTCAIKSDIREATT